VTRDRSVDERISQWLHEEAPDRLPDRVLQAAFERTRGSRQRPSALRLWPLTIIRVPAAFAIGAAAIAVVAIGVFLNMTPPHGGIGGPAPSTTPDSSPTASPASFDAQAQGELEPGSYVLEYFEPLRITFTIPAGWSKFHYPAGAWGEDVGFGFETVDNVYIDPCRSDLGMHDPPIGPTVDDLATALGSVPGWDATAPVDVTLAGYAGKQIDLTAPDSWEECFGGESRLYAINGGTDYTLALSPNEHLRLWILDIEGTRLVVSASYTDAASAAERAELQSAVGSIRIER
jgi:hypothetical protein